MTGPIDTIREALQITDNAALAALTQVEHQLAAHDREVSGLWQLRDTQEARAVAAETALAEANEREAVWRAIADERLEVMRANDRGWREGLEAAEQRANDYERLIVEHHAAGAMERLLPGDECPVCARAALDRQEQT